MHEAANFHWQTVACSLTLVNEHLQAGGAWQNPSFIASLQGQGVSVDLSENDRKRIELSVISASDLLQAMAQIGLEE